MSDDSPLTNHHSRGRSKPGFLLLALLLLLIPGCTKSTEPQRSPDGQPVQSPQDKTSTKLVERPDSLFEQYEYPGARRTAAINLSGTVSATYSSPDEYKKVVDFYREKFSGSKQVSVQETTSYFGVKNPDGSGLTATVSVASDNHTQIILRHDKAQ
jgi:hypothetical protein